MSNTILAPTAGNKTPLRVNELKAQAQLLQDQARSRGEELKRAAALEAIARHHGYRDWNAANAGASQATEDQASDTAQRPLRAFRWLQTPASFDFSKAETRKDFLQFMVDMVNAGHLTRYQARYEAEALNKTTTDLEWTVDAGNDWWVFFEEGHPRLLRIQHRYSDQTALQALCDWAEYRWQLTQVDEPPHRRY